MSFLVYVLGLAALFISDILVTSTLQDTDIALWAEARALIGILGVIAALGLDLVMVRSPQSSTRMLRFVAVQVPLLAILLGFGAHGLGYLSSPLSASLLTAGSAVGLVLGQFYRAHHRYLLSQLIQQGWKIVILAVLGAMALPMGFPALPVDLILGVLLLATSLVGWIPLLRTETVTPVRQEPEGARALYGIGLRFMVTNLILSLAVYGEQLLVNGLGTARDAAVFFTHATYFLFPASVLNGYIAFRIGPWLRDNHERFVQMIGSRWAVMTFGAAFYAVLMNVFGWVSWQIVTPAVGSPDPILQVTLLVSAFARTLYTIPSGYNGVFGSTRQHDLLIGLQVVFLLVLAGLIFAFVGYLDVVYLVALAGASNWVLRTTIGGVISGVIIKSKLNV